MQTLIKNNVLIGKDNYLFLYQGMHKQFDYLLLKEKISIRNVKNFVFNIKRRVNYFNKNNIDYRHIIFPSKPLVKNSFLPKKFSKVYSLYETYYKNECADYENIIIYPLISLKNQDKEYSSFHMYDTHMTDKAYIHILKELFESLNIKFNYNVFNCLYYKNKAGDLTNMLKKKQFVKELFFENRYYKTYQVGNREFLQGNTDEVVILYNKNVTKRLLIFGDSFSKAMLPMYSYHFKDVLYIRSTFVHYDIVEMYKPDVVISGTAERYLCNIKSEKESNNFLMEKYADNTYNPSKEYIEAFMAQLSYSFYPHLYDAWEKKIQETFLSPLHLSIKLLSKDIKLVEEKNELQSYQVIGCDPYIIFNDVYVEDNKKYEFNIRFDSTVNSKFQLFYTTYEENNFSENNSIKKDIKEGLNDINIYFGNINLGSKFRIDPLNNIGEINIYRYELKEANIDKEKK